MALSAQEYEVVSFEVRQNDMTARTNSRVDANGRKCAVVKVYADDKIATARGAVVGKPTTVGMEKQVYMAHDSRQLELVFEHHYPLTIEFMDYGVPSLTGQMTYVLKLKEKGSSDKIGAATNSNNDYSESNNTASRSNNQYSTNQNQYSTNYSNNTSGQTHASNSSNMINGHEYVDLGLPSGLKWATCNIGASSPEEYGDYFAWGETESNSKCNEKNSLTWEKSVSMLKSEGIVNGQEILNRNYDAASVNWGGSWRMPTIQEYNELLSVCKWRKETKNGKVIYRIIGPNGKSIFFPFAGYCSTEYSNVLNGTEEIGCYTWSSSVKDNKTSALGLILLKKSKETDSEFRYVGRSVRPVTE